MTGSRAALDTNIVIDFLNGDDILLRRFELYDHILLPFPVIGELLFGAMCSARPEENIERLGTLFDHFDTIDSSMDVERRYAQMKSMLKRKGRPIPENDIWIAACAQSADVPLLSRDDHFREIDDLSLLEW